MSRLEDLVSEVLLLDSIACNKVSALVGALVADAACLNLEWIYDQEKICEIVGNKNPEFWQESHCPFFTLPSGKMSCNGDLILQSLEVFAENDGKFDGQKLAEKFAKHFGDEESDYQISFKKREDGNFPIDGKFLTRKCDSKKICRINSIK